MATALAARGPPAEMFKRQSGFAAFGAHVAGGRTLPARRPPSCSPIRNTRANQNTRARSISSIRSMECPVP